MATYRDNNSRKQARNSARPACVVMQVTSLITKLHQLEMFGTFAKMGPPST
jgi:hypothetical protein